MKQGAGNRRQELGGKGQKGGKAEGRKGRTAKEALGAEGAKEAKELAPAPCVHNAYPYAWKRRGDNILLPEMLGKGEM